MKKYTSYFKNLPISSQKKYREKKEKTNEQRVESG